MASDGSVKITVSANDRALKDLNNSIEALKKNLKDLSSDNPFRNISDDAVSAVKSLNDVSKASDDVGKALNDVNGDGLYDVSASAYDAEAGLHDASSSAFQLASDVSDINGDGLYDVSDGAYQSSSSLSDASDSAFTLMNGLSDVDGDMLYDVSAGASDASKGLEDVAGSANEASKGTEKLSVSITSFISGAMAISVVKRGFDMIADSVDSAIDRFDTLNTYPRTMEALGYSAEQVERSFRMLDEGIRGLPTRLDDIVRNTQRIALTVGNLDVATETALALNNAFLASGASSAEASRGTEQYIQMLRSGKVDMMSWRTLTETMVVGLDKAAEAFGYTGKTAQQDFYGALRDGKITFEEFNQKMIELNKTQGGFAELAHTNSQTLRTAMTNISTAVVRGVTTIMQKFDELSRAVSGNSIAENINRLQSVVNTAFSLMATSIEIVTPLIVLTADAFKVLYNTTKTLSPVLLTVVSAMIAMRVVNEIAVYTKTLQVTMIALSKAYQYATVTSSQYNATMVAGSAITKGLATAFGILTGAISLKAVALGVAAKAIAGFKAVVLALTGPIGWVIAGVGLLTAGITVLWQTLGKTSPEMESLTEDINKQTDATSQLKDQVTQSAEAYSDRQAELKAQSDSMRTLIDDTVALSEKEVQSAADKAILKDNIESLNESIDGLNLAYDEETGKLNASSEAMKNRLDIIEQENAAAEGQQRLVEINKERSLVEEQLAENSRKLNEAQELLDESGANLFGRNNELKDSISELQTEQGSLKESMDSLNEQYDSTTAKVEEAMQRQTEAIKAHVEEHGWSYDQLSERQQSAVDTMAGQLEQMVANSQDAFSRMNDQSSATAEEMIANLEHNSEMTREWGENRASLMEVASQKGNEGFLMWLEGLAPDSAAELAEVANMSDEQLERFIELMNEAPQTATDSFNTSLGEGMDEAARIIGEKAQVLPESMHEQLSDEKFAEMGRNVGIGLEQGIAESSTQAEEASRSMAEGVDDAAKSALGIHSPSTVFMEHGRNIIAGLVEGLNGGKDQVLQIIQQLGQQMSDAMNQSIQQMSTMSTQSFSGFTQSVQTSMNNATQVVTTSMINMTRAFQIAMTQMNSMSNIGMSGVAQMISRQYSTMTLTVQRETSRMVQMTVDFNNRLSRATELGMQTTTQSVTTHTRRQTQLVEASQRQIVQVVTSGTNNQVSVVRSGYSAMNNQIRSNLSSAVATTRSMMNQAISVMRSAASQARSAGYNMGVGFRNGLASTRGGILSTARSIANTAASTIRSALRIKSPSRVTTEIGRYTGEGLVVGMKNKFRDVKRTADDLAKSAIPNVNVGRTIGGIGINGMNGQSSVQNNQQYHLNVNATGSSNNERETYDRLFREFVWYVQQEKGALDG